MTDFSKKKYSRNELITTDEASRLFGYSTSLIRRWRRQYHVDRFTRRGLGLYRVKDLEKLVWHMTHPLKERFKSRFVRRAEPKPKDLPKVPTPPKKKDVDKSLLPFG